MTSYKILKLADGIPVNESEQAPGTFWTEHGTIEAASAAQARRLAVKDGGEGTYIAVPDRSWIPKTYATTTTTRIAEQEFWSTRSQA